MRTPVDRVQLASLPVGELATSAAPDHWHGDLVALGTHCRDGAWVVSGQREVAAALACPALSTAAAGGQDGPAADLLARMARFSDGPDHRRRRGLVTRLLPPVAEVARAAGARANDHLRRRTAAFDVMPMARLLPAEVLARALGFAPEAADRAAILAGLLCDALTPALAPRGVSLSAADAAAAELSALAAGRAGQDPERIAAVISILFQARDATAALIGLAVLAGGADGTAPGRESAAPGRETAAPGRETVAPGRETVAPGRRIEQVLRRDAPVQCTRRTARADAAIGDVVVPAGAPVWIFMAAAERGSGIPATFGSGPHACPGAAHAAAIARPFVTVLEADGWRPTPGQRIEFEPRPNLRVPARVLVTRR
jgi:cytochrome P450